MTPPQRAALQRLIAADRQFHARQRTGLPVCEDDRGVEVWAHGPITHATAMSLVRAGLAELVDTARNKSLWLFLGSASAFDTVASGSQESTQGPPQ